ncbi:hypothetical protein GQ472_03030 [archaeon]|nr:hypothetical protein [archaeon]
MDNNRYLALFIFTICIFIIFQDHPSITGNILLGEVNVSINPMEYGKISYLGYPAEAIQYSNMDFDIEFRNTGSTPYIKKTLLQIGTYDANMTVIANRIGHTASMGPGDRIFETLKYTPVAYGFYWAHVMVSYGDSTADAWGSFYVEPYYAYVPPIDPGDSTGDDDDSDSDSSSGSSTSPSSGFLGDIFSALDFELYDYGRTMITLSHPDKIYVMSGDTSVVYILVNNTGTMTLRRLLLLPRIIGNIAVGAQPMNIQTLKGGQSAIFMITLDVPAGIKDGIYPMDFKVIANRIERTGHIDVVVGSLLLDENLMDMILNYRYIITRLMDETHSLYLAGGNTTLLERYIDDADSALILAKDYHDLKDYGQVRAYLKDTRGHLELAVIELARLRSSDSLLSRAPMLLLMIAMIVIIAVSLIAVYVHKRSMKKDEMAKKFQDTSMS